MRDSIAQILLARRKTDEAASHAGGLHSSNGDTVHLLSGLIFYSRTVHHPFETAGKDSTFRCVRDVYLSSQ